MSEWKFKPGDIIEADGGKTQRKVLEYGLTPFRESFDYEAEYRVLRLDNDQVVDLSKGYVESSYQLRERPTPSGSVTVEVEIKVPQVYVLTEDQVEALGALLMLVRYDDLAQSWLNSLPEKLRKDMGVGA